MKLISTIFVLFRIIVTSIAYKYFELNVKKSAKKSSDNILCYNKNQVYDN